jgi:adenylate cyclase, class 2
VSTEFEVKILDVDPSAIEARIEALGGTRGQSRLLRRYVYDIAPGDASRWIRLRDVGDKVTLCLKEIHSEGIGGIEETEIAVGNFDTAADLLNKLGFSPKAYQENRRTSFQLGSARLEIDTWPGIPPYLEIEADSADEVLRAATMLGYAESDLTSENTVDVYARYGIDLNDHAMVDFNEPPLRLSNQSC